MGNLKKKLTQAHSDDQINTSQQPEAWDCELTEACSQGVPKSMFL